MFGVRAVTSGDGVVEQQPPRTEQRSEMREVHVEVVSANVFEHPDRGDCVERSVGFAVVDLADRDEMIHSRFLGTAPGGFGLVRRQCGPSCRDPIVGGGVDDERPPATTNIEKLLSGCQLELATDQVELADLCGFECLGRIEERGARVDQVLRPGKASKNSWLVS